METLHRLAGVQDASDLSSSHGAEPPQPVSTSSAQIPPSPLPRDADANTDAASILTSQRVSRASLPLSRKPSHKSFRSSSRRNSTSRRSADLNHLPVDYPATPRLNDHKVFGGSQVDAPAPPVAPPRQSAESARSGPAEGEEDEEDDFAWGPSHPCFPHPNPHCPPDSPAREATRVIRVRRDYLAAGDLYPQFANLYPEILDPLVTDEDFRFIITSVNAICRRAFEPFTTRAWIDSLAGAFTGYLWDDLGLTNAKKGEKELEAFVDRWNREREREDKGVRLVQMRRTGFMTLDFVIPDPGIDVSPLQEGDDGGE